MSIYRLQSRSDLGTTDSSAMEAGVMADFLEALALVEAVVTISGTAYLVIGVRGTRAVAVGAVRQAAEALAAPVHIRQGAMAEAVGAGRWEPP